MSSKEVIFLDDYLVHYGVLGMKWGVRKDRVKKSLQKKRATRKQIKAIKKSRKQAMKNRYLLSDSDLNRRINRLERETRLRQLTEADYSSGRKYAKKTLNKVGDKTTDTLIKVGTGAVSYTVNSSLGIPTGNDKKKKKS